MKGVTNKIKTRKKKAGYLSDSYIKRLIGPIAKSEPDYRKMLRALKARASDERSKAIRAAARKMPLGLYACRMESRVKYFTN